MYQCIVSEKIDEIISAENPPNCVGGIREFNPLAPREKKFSNQPEIFTSSWLWQMESKSFWGRFFSNNRYGDTVLGIFDQLGHIGNFSVGEKSPVWHYLQLQKIFKKWAK